MVTTAGRRSQRVKTERQTVSTSDFAAEMVRLSDEAESHNWLIYGDSNVGKTVLAGTCPGKTFWLVGEPGYKSAGRHGAKGMARVVADTATALAAVDWLNENRRYEKLDWLVIDGLSTMEKRFRLAYAQEAFDIDPAKRQHRNLPDKPDYYNTQNFLTSWIPQLVDMPVNLLITAHAYRTDRTDNGELLVFPGIQGKVTEIANAISGLMDITGFMSARQMRSRDKPNESRLVRRLHFQTPPTREGEDEVRYICGEKYGTLGTHMDSPTIPRLLEKINRTEES